MRHIPFEFGIITDGSTPGRVRRVIESIERLKIPEFHITVVGGDQVPHKGRASFIPFDERKKAAKGTPWITKKKNIITRVAKYPNVVYSHDYVVFQPDWYEGWIRFGDDFKVAMNRIMNTDGSRFRDWILCPCVSLEKAKNTLCLDRMAAMLPYNEKSLSRGMYISGAYWVAKKEVMQEFPLDERLGWNEGEDIIWSHHVRSKYDFTMNPHSTVKLAKYKHPAYHPISNNDLVRLKEFVKNNPIEDGYGMLPRHYPAKVDWSKNDA